MLPFVLPKTRYSTLAENNLCIWPQNSGISFLHRSEMPAHSPWSRHSLKLTCSSRLTKPFNWASQRLRTKLGFGALQLTFDWLIDWLTDWLIGQTRRDFRKNSPDKCESRYFERTYCHCLLWHPYRILYQDSYCRDSSGKNVKLQSLDYLYLIHKSSVPSMISWRYGRPNHTWAVNAFTFVPWHRARFYAKNN